METNHFSYRTFLQKELDRRLKANENYSLRAFARLLQVDASLLSKILRGQRSISVQFIEDTALRLKLSPDLVQTFTSKAKKSPTLATAPMTEQKYVHLSLDSFEVISDWHHYGILELMKVKGFKASTLWISKKLNIEESEVVAATERLQRVGLLKIAAHGKWADLSEGFTTHILGMNLTSYAHKQSQHQILDLAKKALDNTPIEKRDQSSYMVATNQDKIQGAKIMIQKFRRTLAAYLEDCDDKDAVYQLGISLFPVTKDSSKEAENPNGKMET